MNKKRKRDKDTPQYSKPSHTNLQGNWSIGFSVYSGWMDTHTHTDRRSWIKYILYFGGKNLGYSRAIEHLINGHLFWSEAEITYFRVFYTVLYRDGAILKFVKLTNVKDGKLLYGEYGTAVVLAFWCSIGSWLINRFNTMCDLQRETASSNSMLIVLH